MRAAKMETLNLRRLICVYYDDDKKNIYKMKGKKRHIYYNFLLSRVYL